MFTDVFGNMEPVTLGIAVVVCLLAGLIIQNYIASFISVTVGALIVFWLVRFAKLVIIDGQELGALADSWWKALPDIRFGTVLVYFVAFLVAITIAFIVKSVLVRR